MTTATSGQQGKGANVAPAAPGSPRYQHDDPRHHPLNVTPGAPIRLGGVDSSHMAFTPRTRLAEHAGNYSATRATNETGPAGARKNRRRHGTRKDARP